jgi:tRNA dimethylallyltransferase
MIRNGWIPETQTLLDSGYGTDLSAMGGIGYKEISEYLLGNSTWAFCISKIKSRTHRLIRTQSNWFRRIDRSVTWFDSHESNPEKISDQISRLMT